MHAISHAQERIVKKYLQLNDHKWIFLTSKKEAI